MDNSRVRRRAGVVAMSAGICLMTGVSASAQVDPAGNLKGLSLAELMDVEVTSVSKRGESVYDAPASIFVISREDIRRSGATSIPEILRLAPNLQVARMDGDEYAITARGFLHSSANKLLVLMDGRTVYTPLFSGVFWDSQDTLLEDIDRIEVISGPGATLWGANAVNGVINIITRSAADTHGIVADGTVGDWERGVSLRYGGELAPGASFRVYGKFHDWDSTRRPDRSRVEDEWHRAQVGFRADWIADQDHYTVQGDFYDGSVRSDAADAEGANLLARWSRTLADGGRFQVQAYFDHTLRNFAPVFRENLDTFDVEFQHFFRPHDNHAITWGGGYRHSDDEVDNSAFLAFLPANRDLDWGNVFIQDEIRIVDSLQLTLGAKADYNPYTSVEFLPSVRLAWNLAPNHMVWSSLSRAVRAPSRIDTDLFVPGVPPHLIHGGPDFEAEVFNVLEAGYRTQPTPDTSLSVTFFRSEHDKLRGAVFSLDPFGFRFENPVEGDTTGVEAWGSYQPAKFWVLNAGMVYMDKDLRLKAGGAVPPGLSGPDGNDPEYQWTLRSWFDLPHDFELDMHLRGVGSLPEPAVPDYTELNVRLGWRPLPGVELALIGQNLLHADHVEFVTDDANSEVDRAVYFRASWKF